MRLVIYEDNDKLRSSLELLFSSMNGITSCHTFSNCILAAEQAIELKPDVVLMDIDMPECDGIEGVKDIKEANPDVRVIMHTVFDDDQRIFNALAAGADGYLLKNSNPMELFDAIKNVSTGGAPMSPGVARKVLESFRQKDAKEEYEALSEREKQILLMLTKGFTYKRISAECGISIDTTRTHIKNIYTKLHVNCGTEAVAKAMRLKILDL